MSVPQSLFDVVNELLCGCVYRHPDGHLFIDERVMRMKEQAIRLNATWLHRGWERLNPSNFEVYEDRHVVALINKATGDATYQNK